MSVAEHRNDHAINQALLFRSGRMNALALIRQNLAAAQFAAWRQDQHRYDTALNHAIVAVKTFCQKDRQAQTWLTHAEQLTHQAVAYPIKNQKALLCQLTLLGANI